MNPPTYSDIQWMLSSFILSVLFVPVLYGLWRLRPKLESKRWYSNFEPAPEIMWIILAATDAVFMVASVVCGAFVLIYKTLTTLGF